MEDVKIDGNSIKVTAAAGKVDPAKLRDKVADKTKKKVELVSPQPKKDGGGDKKPDDKKPPAEEKKAEEKKPKEVTVANLRLLPPQ